LVCSLYDFQHVRHAGVRYSGGSFGKAEVKMA